ncbi:MAG: DUF721 domain-containing protein [Leptospirales bacterium]
MSFVSLGSLTNRMAPRWASSEDLIFAAIRREWTRSFPESISEHSYPLSFSGNLVVIGVDSPIRQREFSFLEPQLRESLHRFVPELPDCTLRFRVIRPFSPRARVLPAAPLSDVRLEELEQKAAGIVSVISDTRIRGGAFKLVLQCLIQGAMLGLGDGDSTVSPGPDPRNPDRK